MKTIVYFLIGIGIVIFSSCEEIYFDDFEPQEKPETKIQDNENDSVNKKDTIPYHFVYTDTIPRCFEVEFEDYYLHKDSTYTITIEYNSNLEIYGEYAYFGIGLKNENKGMYLICNWHEYELEFTPKRHSGNLYVFFWSNGKFEIDFELINITIN